MIVNHRIVTHTNDSHWKYSAGPLNKEKKLTTSGLCVCDPSFSLYRIFLCRRTSPRNAAATIPDESLWFRSAQEDERAQAAGLTDADAGIATGVAEMDYDDDLEVEGNIVIISATTPSEELFSCDSEEFRTPDTPTPDEQPLLDPE